MSSLAQVLGHYGADGTRVLSLGGDLRPATVPFVDIVSSKTDRPDAVVQEAAGNPVAYVVDARNQEVSGEAVARLRRALAFRGDAGFLAVVRPGRLDVYEVALADVRAADAPVAYANRDDIDAAALFPRLDIVPSIPDRRGHAIHEALFRLMKEAIDAIHAPRTSRLKHLVGRQDALSLVGRAVFVRFLFDRGLLKSGDAERIADGVSDPRSLFDSPALAARTSRWLDDTFNGDILPVSFPVEEHELDRRIHAEGWTALGNILRDAPGGQLPLEAGLEGPVTWSGLDFSRIPVGVLSQVYEQQAHHWDPKSRKDRSVYYTPSAIAGFVVSEAFRSLAGANLDLASLRLLDPAVGGGVFVVAALRELAAQYWTAAGTRPDTPLLRRIVYEQLRGFDVEPTALRLSALSLYLAAIELDPEPLPLAGLRFDRPLVGHTLHDVGGTDAAGRAGSLGSNVGPEHDHQYDVVLGNPPWTSARVKKDVQQEVLAVLRPIVSEILGKQVDEDFSLPDGNPDVGFLWRAAKWCKPGGRIALVAHARLLFKQSEVGRAARDALAHAFTWTGVLNGAAVRMTDVWPNVTAPFALFFGINEPPGPDDGFYYYSPYLEKGVNDRGRLRVDAKEAHPVRLEALERTPYLLKVLFRGSALDLDVMRTVAKAGPTVEEYWQGKLGLQLGQGYQVALSSGRRDASFLMNLPDVTATTVGRTPLIDLSALPLFRKPELCWPRQPEIYKGPLVLVRESILADPRRPSVFLATQDAAFSRSFYGFSAFGHPQATDLTRYLALILAAPLMRWYGLMTSSKYGVERDVLLFEDVRRFPIPPLDDLAPDLRQAVPELWASYARERRVTSSHEAWAQEVYGLTADDWQVVTDTLEVGGPQAGVAKRASASPSRREVLAFGQVLRSVLETALGEKIAVKAGELPASSPWQFVWLTPALQSGKAAGKDRPGPWLTMLADAYAASATHVVREGGVLVCRLRQYRYWTPSRARLTALELLRDAEATSALVST